MWISKKNETNNVIYLVCTIRRRKENNCPDKAKFIKNTGEIQIYEKCNNNENIHKYIDFEIFKKFYANNNYDKIDLKIKLYQKFFTQCLFLDNKAHNYTEIKNIFQDKFKNIEYLLT